MARSLFVIPLSASKPAALVTQAERLADFMAKNPHTNVVDLARTLGTRRSKLSERGYTLAGQKSLGEDLQAERLQKVFPGRSYSTHPFAFVFTGEQIPIDPSGSFFGLRQHLSWASLSPSNCLLPDTAMLVSSLQACANSMNFRPRGAVASDG